MDFFKNFNKIVLCAGHGEGDPGAVNGSIKESDHNIFITDIIASNLRERGITVDVVPHSLGLASSIAWVNNQNYPAYNQTRKDNVWVLEIHRDGNFPALPQEQKDNQIGIYYFDENRDGKESSADGISFQVAEAMIQKYLALGAYRGNTANLFDFDGSWIKDHFLNWAGYNLGWIERTRPTSHLLEHGYVSGNPAPSHLTKLANWSSEVIFEIFTGKPYNNNSMTYEQQFQSDVHKLNRICAIQGFAKDDILAGPYKDLHSAVSNNDLAYILNQVIIARQQLKNSGGNSQDSQDLQRIKEILTELNTLVQ